ncbi:MAG TPA: 4-hydroxy-tetrahydrodipicolinate synthase [Actinomycetota bacterium]|nr:4-hydroxy-tetrahydrodipicolinate synthase [Actinomycetota bacterium]
MFGRVITAMATPFTAGGDLDLDGARALAQHLLANGSDGIVVCGSTGESPTLTFEEKRDLIAAVADAVGGRADVIAGTGTYDTRESIHLSQMAAENGANGLLVVTPYYSRPPQSGLLAHFKAVADATPLPVILYDIPVRTGRKIDHDTLLDLAGVANIIGVKDAAGDLAGTARLAAEKPAEFIIWSGDDALALPMMSVGAYGVISVAAHLAGPKIKEMIESYVKGDTDRAGSLARELVPLFDVLFITSNPIPLKAGLALAGLPAGDPRLPLPPATSDERSKVHRVLKELGLL